MASGSSASSNVVGVHYRVGKKIGEGSFGVIFEGTNLLNQQQVAIKFEPRKSDAPQLRDEYRTYKILVGCRKCKFSFSYVTCWFSSSPKTKRGHTSIRDSYHMHALRANFGWVSSVPTRQHRPLLSMMSASDIVGARLGDIHQPHVRCPTHTASRPITEDTTM
jgi:hypothetical protein